MKYKVNQEGIEALNGLQKELKNQLDVLAQCAMTLQSQIDSNQQGAGPHYDDIQSMVYQIADVSGSLEEPIEEVCESLGDLAESYQDIIDKKLGAAAFGAAGSAVGAGSAFGGGSFSGGAGSSGGKSFGSHFVSDNEYDTYSQQDAVGMSDREKNVVQNYTGTTYSGMNERLRENQYGNPNVPVSLAYDGQITVMTDYLDRHELPADCDVFRGVGKADFIFGSDVDNLSDDELDAKYKGTMFRDKSFGSTSTSIDVAKKFSSGTLLEISAPKGARGAFVGNTSTYHSEEREIILQRGTIYSIDKVYRKDGYLVVQMTARGRRL